ncbi:hypothetical protein PM082_004963 [Marasmius tenuissimus]|nr:hypothetical protein PM082_004963 [Marasmius tenuissimus]
MSQLRGSTKTSINFISGDPWVGPVLSWLGHPEALVYRHGNRQHAADTFSESPDSYSYVDNGQIFGGLPASTRQGLYGTSTPHSPTVTDNVHATSFNRISFSHQQVRSGAPPVATDLDFNTEHLSSWLGRGPENLDFR